MATSSDISTSEDNALPTFLKFPKLPLELRDEIWEYHRTPRLIEIIQRNYPAMGNRAAANPIGQLHESIGCFATPPMLLSISRESRAVALRKYHVAFEHILVSPAYIDFSIDVLACFSISTWLSFAAIARITGKDQIQFDRVKNLALPAPTPTYDSRPLINMVIEANKDFPALKQLIIVEPLIYINDPRRCGSGRPWAFEKIQF
ncbi:hypothetical protein BKA65DRAFT_548550 [Rhexocercosporidium sp. MPI-PUGE-AT-0058]|nr:hypothetical protein BKA65DRAFT_548550 [Rhexocercosporidium sp. MPI-PUGE-AT-0058]